MKKLVDLIKDAKKIEASEVDKIRLDVIDLLQRLIATGSISGQSEAAQIALGKLSKVANLLCGYEERQEW